MLGGALACVVGALPVASAGAAVSALNGPHRVVFQPGQLLTDRMLWVNGAAAGADHNAAALRVDGAPVRADGAVAPNVAEIVSTADSDSSNALSVTSANRRDTALGVTGAETGRGTVKVTHRNTGPARGDVDASALSLNLTGPSPTAAQGIFLDAPSPGTSGKLLNLRNGGDEKFTVGPQGELTTSERPGDPPAPAPDRATVYTRDNGGGKTQLVVRFSSGAPVVVATQP